MKPGQKPEERARDIESALDWMRNNGMTPDDGSLPDFRQLGSIPVSRRTPEEKRKDLDNVLNWIRNGKDDSDDPTGEFKKIDQMIPQKRGQSPEDRA